MQITTGTPLADFASQLKHAVVASVKAVGVETPYAYALVLGQVGNWLGYAVATEEGLRRVAQRYHDLGYRYADDECDEAETIDLFTTWMRWSNPDDGWFINDFPESSGILATLERLVEQGRFGPDAEELEAFCTEVLASLAADGDWQRMTAAVSIVAGVTYGEDPDDFLRTAVRVNSFEVARRLWWEFRKGEGLEADIRKTT